MAALHDFYRHVHPAQQHACSTFALDVDAAPYNDDYNGITDAEEDAASEEGSEKGDADYR